MVKCKYEGTGIWNGRCTGTKEVDLCPGYDKCKQYKPNYTTNADRIRSMSDDELAVWLVDKTVYQESAFSSPSYLNFLTDADDTKAGAIKGTVEWLKQPAESEGARETANYCTNCGAKMDGGGN